MKKIILTDSSGNKRKAYMDENCMIIINSWFTAESAERLGYTWEEYNPQDKSEE